MKVRRTSGVAGSPGWGPYSLRTTASSMYHELGMRFWFEQAEAEMTRLGASSRCSHESHDGTKLYGEYAVLLEARCAGCGARPSVTTRARRTG